MKKKLKVVMIMLLMGCVLASPAFADYHDRNVFNRFTDWCATMGRNQDDRQRIVNERSEARAQWREAHDRQRGHDDHDDHGDHGDHDDHRS